MKPDPQRWAAYGLLLVAMLCCAARGDDAPIAPTPDTPAAAPIEPVDPAAAAAAAEATPNQSATIPSTPDAAPPASDPIVPRRIGFTPTPQPEPRGAITRTAVTPPSSPASPSPATAADPTDIPMPLPAQEDLPLGTVRDAPPAIAGAASAANPATPATPGSTGWMLQTVVALAIVIGLIFGLRMLLQKLTGQTPIGSSSRIVEVLGRSAVAPRTNVLLLKIDQTVLVVGQTATGLSTLATFDEPTQVARLLTQINASRPLSITEGFRSVLATFDRDYQPDDANETDAPATATDAAGDGEQYVDRTRHQVSGLLSRIRNLRRKDSA